MFFVSKTKVKQIFTHNKEVFGNESLPLILIKPTNYRGSVKMISRCMNLKKTNDNYDNETEIWKA